jgi:hypothetical protein
LPPIFIAGTFGQDDNGVKEKVPCRDNGSRNNKADKETDMTRDGRALARLRTAERVVTRVIDILVRLHARWQALKRSE